MASGLVLWGGKKERIIAFFSIEAWLVHPVKKYSSGVLDDENLQQYQETLPFCDNQSVFQLTNYPVFHAKNMHIQVFHHSMRGLVQNKEIEFIYCRSQDQLAHFFQEGIKQGLIENVQGDQLAGLV